jgi:hypothetical protein
MLNIPILRLQAVRKSPPVTGTAASIQRNSKMEARGEERARHSTRLLVCSRKGRTGQNFQFDSVAMTVRVGRKHAPCVFGVMRVEPRRQPKCLLTDFLRCIIDSAKVDSVGPRFHFRCNRSRSGSIRLNAFAIRSTICGSSVNAIVGASPRAKPVVFGPGTLWRTWGTRPIPSDFCYDTDSSGTGPSPHLNPGLTRISCTLL